MIQLMGFPILLGFTLAFFWPYVALDLGGYSIFFLSSLMFATTLLSDWKIREHWRDFFKFEFQLVLFLCFLLLPAVFWLLSHSFLAKQGLDYGIFWAALCPIAIVAPQFSGKKADREFSFTLVIGTAILFPFFAVLMNFLFFPHFARLQILSQVRDMIFLTTVPTLIGFSIRSLLPRNLLVKMRVGLPHFNMIIIGLLSYLYMGAALQKLNISNFHWTPIIFALFLAFLMDFGTYLITPFLLKGFPISAERKESIRICLSMKNVAISGGILLFEFPISTLASSFVFLAHSVLFTILGRNHKRIAPANGKSNSGSGS